MMLYVMSRREARIASQLEIGCGNHRTSKADVGIDIERKSMCDVVTDAHHLPFKGSVFDKVLFFEVLEHLNSPRAALT